MHPLAGQPAPPQLLIDVARLERDYYERQPNPEDPAQRVSFGTSGHRGSALHDALNEFLKAYPSGLLPPDAIGRFEALGEKHLEALLTAPAERAFWWPRFQRLAHWFVATENARRTNLRVEILILNEQV